jgi:vacuolar-type H+-ATPase subunit C/Vma6
VADEKRTDLLGKLSELSEEAMHRLQEAPGGDRVVGTITSLRDRVDELQRRVRGLDQLETRLTALEKKVDRLAKDAGSSTSRRGATTKP